MTLLQRLHFAPAILSGAMWRYSLCPLCLRMVEDTLAVPGEGSPARRYGAGRRSAVWPSPGASARCVRRPRGRGEKRQLDGMVVTRFGKTQRRWRAVNRQGAPLEVLVQSRRDTATARRLMRRRLTRYARPCVIVTDKLRRDAAANRELGPSVEARQHSDLDNRAENSRQPTRGRKKRMRRGKSTRQAQRFAAVYGRVSNLCMACRHRYRRNAVPKCAVRARPYAARESTRAARLEAWLSCTCRLGWSSSPSPNHPLRRNVRQPAQCSLTPTAW